MARRMATCEFRKKYSKSKPILRKCPVETNVNTGEILIGQSEAILKRKYPKFTVKIIER